jgi:hypothetical protein
LAAGGLPADPAIAEGLVVEAVEHARRWQSQDALRDRVGEMGRPTVELPMLVGPIDLGALHELADRLEAHLAQGVAA